HLSDAVFVVQVHPDGDGAARSLLYLARDPLCALTINVSDDDGRTLACKAFGSSLANARRCTGYHGRPAFQSAQFTLPILSLHYHISGIDLQSRSPKKPLSLEIASNRGSTDKENEWPLPAQAPGPPLGARVPTWPRRADQSMAAYMGDAAQAPSL